MSKPVVAMLLSVVLTLPLIACAAESPPTKTGMAAPTRIPPVVDATAPRPVGVAVPTSSMPPAVRRAVVADAAKRFKVAESAVVLVQAEKVTWSDAALGCPQPGFGYTQATVEGFRVIAKTSAGSLVYSTDSGGHVVACAAAGRRADVTPPVMDNEPRPYTPDQAPPQK